MTAPYIFSSLDGYGAHGLTAYVDGMLAGWTRVMPSQPHGSEPL